MDISPLRRSGMVPLDKNYGRRHETMFKKACNAYATFGGRFLLEDGSTGGEDLLKVTVIQQFGPVKSVFSSHFTDTWPPNREELLNFHYIEGPQDYAIRGDGGSSSGISDEKAPRPTVSQYVQNKPAKTISQKTGAPVTNFGRTLEFTIPQEEAPRVETPPSECYPSPGTEPQDTDTTTLRNGVILPRRGRVVESATDTLNPMDLHATPSKHSELSPMRGRVIASKQTGTSISMDLHSGQSKRSESMLASDAGNTFRTAVDFNDSSPSPDRKLSISRMQIGERFDRQRSQSRSSFSSRRSSTTRLGNAGIGKWDRKAARQRLKTPMGSRRL